MNSIEYYVASSDDIDSLMSKVNELLEEGYTLHGNLFSQKHSDYNNNIYVKFYQSMIIDHDKVEKMKKDKEAKELEKRFLERMYGTSNV